MTTALPSIVIAGRPNVGKSTLFNRLTSSRRSIVNDQPGITRDRIYGIADWQGRRFEVVDTGGIVPDDRAAIPHEIMRQAQVAFDSATLIVLVVDARTGLTPLDEELARLLRRTGKPLILAANKVDSQQQVSLTGPLHSLGVPVFPLSAEHGFGVDVLLDYVSEKIPAAPVEPENSEPEAGNAEDEISASASDAPGEGEAAKSKELNIAIIGRPNVGKSALLNRLAGEERSIVSPTAGTTRDSVDTVVSHNGKLYRFVDTAGIRRKGKTNLMAEKLSVMMARRALERADIALLIVDSALGVTANDATIAGYAQESGCSVIIVMNKWDLSLEAAKRAIVEERMRGGQMRVKARPVRAPSGKRTEEVPQQRMLRSLADPVLLMKEYETLVRDKLKFLAYAPIVFLSALTGDRLDSLYPMIERAADARRRRISTGELNRWLATVDLERGTSPATRKVKIFYMTQASSAPPTFVLFTNQPLRLHFSYERFLENRLREKFDFTAAPLRFLQRMKERGHRERGRKPMKPRRGRIKRHGKPSKMRH
ncbi:MAG: ribosome biogenesis GTPase Der [Candidatus Acidiferrales bacterium]